MSRLRQQYLEAFEKVYRRLNPQQRLAVDTIEGPVMVIAGPGTGKTQVLGARIGKILMETDTDPGNILCLTYTDAGVVAMRKRLLQFIGADAYKVNVFTFHAFCNEVIQENLSLFEKQAMDPVSDLERVELLKGLIDALPKGNPLKRYRGDVYYEMDHLAALFSVMKREGWTPDFLEERIGDHVRAMEDPLQRDDLYYKNSRAGKWQKGDRKPAFGEEVERLEKLKAGVREFGHYQEAMRRRNRYDFDDMINWVIGAFRNNPSLLADYQERYLYILVDEYQDTSRNQNALVELLIEYWENPNVFVVGDDDQSIFRFQGANMVNMKAFMQKRRQGELLEVVLQENYRSTQPILDLAGSLIGRNEERLVRQMSGLNKDLVSEVPVPEGAAPWPKLEEYLSTRHEMVGLVEKIGERIKQGTAHADIAVIYKENKFGEELAHYLLKRQIPFYSRRKRNLLGIPLVKHILTLLRYLDAEMQLPFSGDPLLFQWLHFPFQPIPPMEVARISVHVNERKYQGNYSLRQYLYEKAREVPADLFAPPPPEGIVRISALIEGWMGAQRNETLQQLFERIIREGGILSYIVQSPDKVWLMQVLTALFDFLKAENQRKKDLDLRGLVETIDLMESNGLPVSITQLEGNEQGVNLLTAHGSKGLEFEWVFMAGCNKEFWEGKRKQARGYTLPREVFEEDEPALLTERRRDEEELRRLFYVAMTRAKTHLTLSWSRFREDGKEMEKSVFIEEIREEQPLQIEEAVVTQEALTDAELSQFAEGQAPEIAKAEEDFLKPLLERFVMNVTALNNYLYCPLQFYYQSLIRVPSGKSESAEFGVAVHFALKRLFEKMQAGTEPKAFPGKEVFLDDFEWWLSRHRESFTREGFARRLEYGREVLGQFYDQYAGAWTKVTLVELSVRTAVGDIPVKGQLDKLEFTGNKVNVVDYKTGDPEKALVKLKGPGEKQPLGGDYWRQGVFYKILLDHYPRKNWEVVSTAFDFVEPDKKKTYRQVLMEITPADIATVKEQMRHVWDKIQARDFYVGCGRKDCYWCNFAKDHRLAVAMHTIVEEEEPEETF